MSDPERQNYDEDFSKGPRYPFAMTVAVTIWMNGGGWMAGLGIRYSIVEIINGRLDLQTVLFSLLWYVVGIKMAVEGIRYWVGKPQTARSLFVSSVWMVFLSGLGLLVVGLRLLEPKGIGPLPPPTQKPFDNEVFPLFVMTGLSYLTAMLVREGTDGYRVWKKYQIENEKRQLKETQSSR